MLEQLTSEEYRNLKAWAVLKYGSISNDFDGEKAINEILIDHDYLPQTMSEEEKYGACCEIRLFGNPKFPEMNRLPSFDYEYSYQFIDKDLDAELAKSINQYSSTSCIDRTFGQCSPEKFQEFKKVLASCITITLDEDFFVANYKLFDMYSYGRFNHELIKQFSHEVAIPYIWMKQADPTCEPSIEDLYPQYYGNKVAFFDNYDREQAKKERSHQDPNNDPDDNNSGRSIDNVPDKNDCHENTVSLEEIYSAENKAIREYINSQNDDKILSMTDMIEMANGFIDKQYPDDERMANVATEMAANKTEIDCDEQVDNVNMTEIFATLADSMNNKNTNVESKSTESSTINSNSNTIENITANSKETVSSNNSDDSIKQSINQLIDKTNNNNNNNNNNEPEQIKTTSNTIPNAIIANNQTYCSTQITENVADDISNKFIVCKDTVTSLVVYHDDTNNHFYRKNNNTDTSIASTQQQSTNIETNETNSTVKQTQEHVSYLASMPLIDLLNARRDIFYIAILKNYEKDSMDTTTTIHKYDKMVKMSDETVNLIKNIHCYGPKFIESGDACYEEYHPYSDDDFFDSITSNINAVAMINKNKFNKLHPKLQSLLLDKYTITANQFLHSDQEDKVKPADMYKVIKQYNRGVFTYGPGSGKTSAVTRLMADKCDEFKFIYSAKRIDECIEVFNKLISYKSMKQIPEHCTISLITSDTPTDYDSVYTSDIVICTHNRLLMEDPDTLIGNSSSRKKNVLICDEKPADLFKNMRISNALLSVTIMVMKKLNIDVFNDNTINKDGLTTEQYNQLYNLLSQITEKHIYRDNFEKNYTSLDVFENLTIANMLINDLKTYNINATGNINAGTKRIAYFGSFLINETVKAIYEAKHIGVNNVKTTKELVRQRMAEKRANHEDVMSILRNDNTGTFDTNYDALTHLDTTATDLIVDKKIVYSIRDAVDKFDKSFILDGTGDIYFGKTKLKIFNDQKYCRVLRLRNKIQIINNSQLTWKNTNAVSYEKTKENLINTINTISKWLDDHPGEECIVIGTQCIDVNLIERTELEEFEQDCINESENKFKLSIAKYINSYLPEELTKRIHYIHYQSGKETSTNEFSHCTGVFILNIFHLPNDTWHSIKTCLNLDTTETSYYHHTLSLIIQGINRSNNRVSGTKGIDLFFSDEFIKLTPKYLLSVLTSFSKFYFKGYKIKIFDLIKQLAIEYNELAQLILPGNIEHHDRKISVKQFIIENCTCDESSSEGKIVMIPAEVNNVTDFKKALQRLSEKHPMVQVSEVSREAIINAGIRIPPKISYRRFICIKVNTDTIENLIRGLNIQYSPSVKDYSMETDSTEKTNNTNNTNKKANNDNETITTVEVKDCKTATNDNCVPDTTALETTMSNTTTSNTATSDSSTLEITVPDKKQKQRQEMTNRILMMYQQWSRLALKLYRGKNFIDINTIKDIKYNSYNRYNSIIAA